MNEATKGLEDKSGRPKDIWDKLQASSGVIAAILIPLVLAFVNQTYNERQKIREDNRQQVSTRVHELDTVQRFVAYLASPDDKTNEVAILAICALGNQELATQLARLMRSRGTAAALDHIQASGTSCAPKEAAAAPQPVTVEPSGVDRPTARSGWAFLGTFSDVNKTWETNYFDFAKNATPQSLLQRKELRVSTSVNLREGMPNPDGTFPRVVDVLKPGSRVEILEIQPWQTTGFYWARVSYAPVKE